MHTIGKYQQRKKKGGIVMVFKYIKHVLGAFPEADRAHLKNIEKLNNCRFTLESTDDFVKDLDFFRENEDHLLLIQRGLCIPFSNVNPKAPLYGVIKDPEGFKILTGKDRTDFVCLHDGTQLVPMWVYNPNS